MCAFIQIILVFSVLVNQVSSTSLVIAVTDGHFARHFLTVGSIGIQSVTPKDATKFGASIQRITYNFLYLIMEPSVRKRHKNRQRDNEVYVIEGLNSAYKDNKVPCSSWKLAKYFRVKTQVEKTVSTVEVTETGSWRTNTRTAHTVTINGCTWGQVTYNIHSLTQDVQNLQRISFESNEPNIEIENSDTDIYVAFFDTKVWND